jgi:RNA-directed DNA polymerase
MGKLALAASSLDKLFHAWRDVRSHVARSSWPQLSAELGEIDADPLRALQALQQQLRQNSYHFSPKWGYAKRKSGGSRRGITVQCVTDRIVQRSILNVIYTQDRELQKLLGDIPRILDTPTSFAGVPGRGVPEAVAMAVTLIRGGARAFALSDMKDFFPRVPRGEVVSFLRENVLDEDFVDLFRAALETEIQNQDVIAEWLDLFPITEIGVAQGSLLSVLVGNLALRHFDVRLNNHQLTTIRYLDDFAIFGPDLDSVRAGFREAQDELAKLGMTCYAPDDGSHKAFLGLVSNGFEFLGCRVHPDGVSPARRPRRKLVRDIALIISEAKGQIRTLMEAGSKRRTERVYAQTLVRIDKKVCGWGDAYRFVSNRVAFAQIDAEIDALLDEFRRWFSRRYNGADPRARRRILGVALLSDTPPKPLAVE